jgi:hypothetical protein
MMLPFSYAKLPNSKDVAYRSYGLEAVASMSITLRGIGI